MEDFGSEWSRGVRVALLEDGVDGMWPLIFFHASLTFPSHCETKLTANTTTHGEA